MWRELALLALCCVSLVRTEEPSVVERTGLLFDSGRLTDINVTVGTGEEAETFHLHRLILAMTSPVWERLVYDGSGSLRLNDIHPATFVQLMNYVYKDELNLTFIDVADDMWQAAVTYKLDHLLGKTVERIKMVLSSENVLAYLEKAVKFREKRLEEVCLQKIDCEASDVVADERFLHIKEETLKRILQRPLFDLTEAQIVTHVLDWAKASLSRDNLTPTAETLRRRLHGLLPFLDLDKLTPDEYVQIVEPTGILLPEARNQRLKAMLKQLLPTNKTSRPRRKERETRCQRWSYNNGPSDDEDDDADYVTNSTRTLHALRFSVRCDAPACYFSGFQLTMSFTNSQCELVDLPVNFTLFDVTNAEELVRTSKTLLAPSYVLRLPTPARITSKSLYRITVGIKPFNVGVDTLCGEGSGDGESHISHQTEFRGLKHGDDCKQNIQCGRISVRFHNETDLRSIDSATNIHKGLITALYFIQ